MFFVTILFRISYQMRLLVKILFLCASFISAVRASEVRPPNIVVIFADDLGYGDISSFGATGISTPNIDSIGKNGFISRDFFVPANVCSPSRASLLTGRYPIKNRQRVKYW